jgi:hypothetical protein
VDNANEKIESASVGTAEWEGIMLAQARKWYINAVNIIIFSK